MGVFVFISGIAQDVPVAYVLTATMLGIASILAIWDYSLNITKRRPYLILNKAQIDDDSTLSFGVLNSSMIPAKSVRLQCGITQAGTPQLLSVPKSKEVNEFPELAGPLMMSETFKITPTNAEALWVYVRASYHGDFRKYKNEWHFVFKKGGRKFEAMSPRDIASLAPYLAIKFNE